MVPPESPALGCVATPPSPTPHQSCSPPEQHALLQLCCLPCVCPMGPLVFTSPSIVPIPQAWGSLGCTETPGSLGQRGHVPASRALLWDTAAGGLPSP